MAARLFSEIQLGGLRLANRICVPPMSRYCATDGKATAEHRAHYARMVSSGAGLVIVEACAVSAMGRMTSADLVLENEAQEVALADLVRHCRTASDAPRLFLQLSHAGRKAGKRRGWGGCVTGLPPIGNLTSVGPTATPYSADYPVPQALTEAGIEEIIAAFSRSVARAARAGFDGVELHAADGFLLHEFLSPVTNTRQDAWGGSTEGRMRLALAVFDAVRQASDLPVMVRLPATDWIAGGWDEGQAAQFARALEKAGVVALDVSAGGLDPRQRVPALSEGYQVPYAEGIRRAAGIPVMTSGRITDPLKAEAILVAGKADLIGVGRQMLTNPDWGWQAAASLSAGAALTGLLPGGGF